MAQWERYLWMAQHYEREAYRNAANAAEFDRAGFFAWAQATDNRSAECARHAQHYYELSRLYRETWK